MRTTVANALTSASPPRRYVDSSGRRSRQATIPATTNPPSVPKNRIYSGAPSAGSVVPAGGRSTAVAATVAPTSASPADRPAPSAAATSETGSISDVHHPPHRVERRLGDRLRQGRVGVDREIDFFHGVLVLAGHRELVDDLRGVAAHDVGPQDLAVLLVADDLHEPLGL